MARNSSEIETATPKNVKRGVVPYNFTDQVDPRTGRSVVIKASSREEAHAKFSKKFHPKK